MEAEKCLLPQSVHPLFRALVGVVLTYRPAAQSVTVEQVPWLLPVVYVLPLSQLVQPRFWVAVGLVLTLVPAEHVDHAVHDAAFDPAE